MSIRELDSSEARVFRAARWAALRSLNYTIDRLNEGDGSVAQKWMGVSHPLDLKELARRLSKVRTALQAIHEKQIGYDTETDARSDWLAEVNVSLRGTEHFITLAHPFFKSKTYGHNSRASTLIHEVSHFRDVLNTDDNADGRDECLLLVQRAMDNDEKLKEVINNADSWAYLVEDTY